MKKMLLILPLTLCGCDTIHSWADSMDRTVGKYMPTIDVEPASAPQKQSQNSEGLVKTNTNMYSVPQK